MVVSLGGGPVASGGGVVVSLGGGLVASGGAVVVSLGGGPVASGGAVVVSLGEAPMASSSGVVGGYSGKNRAIFFKNARHCKVASAPIHQIKHGSDYSTIPFKICGLVQLDSGHTHL